MSLKFIHDHRGLAFAFLGGAAIGGVASHYYTKRQVKLETNKERADLYEVIHLQDELNKIRDKQWQEEYQKVYDAYKKLEQETTERDYEEFKAPDTNDDDMISRAEFNTYVRKYLSSFPELSEKDFPKFEEFDLDNNDGMVSFDEWQRFLQIQKANEAKEKKNKLTIGDGKKNDVYNDLIDALYNESGGEYNNNDRRRGQSGTGRAFNRNDY